MIMEREKVLTAYQRALELGAHTHDEAVASAAQALGVLPEIVEAAVWQHEEQACAS